jgi:hypothetical protein
MRIQRLYGSHESDDRRRLHGHRRLRVLGVHQPILGDAAFDREVDRQSSIWQLPGACNDRDPEWVPTKGERCPANYAGDLLLNPFVFINQSDHSGFVWVWRLGNSLGLGMVGTPS